MTNKQIAKVIQKIGTLLELKGENPFKTRAYTNAARRIDTWEEPVSDLVAGDRLDEFQRSRMRSIECGREPVTRVLDEF